MPTVSLSFLLTIGVLAIAAGVLGFLTPNPIADVIALLLAVYAVHGLWIRLAFREQGDPREIREQAAKLQEALEREKTRLERERAERLAREKQWIG